MHTPAVVALNGTDFYASASLACWVDGVAMPTTYESPAAVLCALPALSIGWHTVTATNDGVHVNGSLSFPVYGVPTLSEVTAPTPYHPNNVSVVVAVIGQDFFPFATLTCLVNGTRVPATYMNASWVACALPPLPNGYYALAVSHDDGLHASNTLSFLVLGTCARLVGDFCPVRGY